MGRYKFPGKPTKHVNKKRVNVLSCPSTKSNETSIVYNESLNSFDICNTYRDSSKRTKILPEFNMQEAYHGKHADAENRIVDGNASICSNTSINNITLDNKTSDCERLAIVRRANKSNAFLYNYKNYHLKHESSKATRKRLMKKGSELRIVSKVDVHESVPRRSLYRRKKPIKDKTISSRETTNLVGKFVLPSKSLHSSRVIIPNKRFINNEQIYNKNDVERNSRKTKTIAQCNNENKNDCSRKKEPVIEEVLKSAVQNHCDEFSYDSSKDSSDMVLIDSSGNTNAPKSCTKLILRKARLQLRTHVSEDMDGPFSSYTASVPNPPGTVTCGVCGAVRFYRFVKQARKFNIYSCESCRKFISKMIKRQTCSKNCSISTLVCHKGQGMCHVPPIVRSQQWKLLRCAYKARCPACWLKMCLQSFQMPSQLKLNLTNMLPENMRTYEHSNQYDIVPQINQLTNLQEIQTTHTNDASQIKLQEQLGMVLETAISPVKLEILSSKTETLLKDMKNEKKQKPRTRVASQKKNDELSNTMPDCTKRQKIDLKGPRVKHVCRSASIVLGQPIATFSREFNDDTEKNRPLCEASSETDACINCTTMSDGTSETIVQEKCFTVATNKKNLLKSSSNNSIVSLPASNVCLTVPSDSSNELWNQHDVAKHPLKPVVTISADYFDNYDSESKIYSSGFGLIGSEPFAVQAVCFYCGSAGQEQLLYCSCCCEPYHYYCINDSVIHRYLYNNNVTQSTVDVNTNSNLKLLWKCSRCSICYECGKADKGKRTCQLCYRYFHLECMQPEWGNSNKPTICSLCLRCEDCGSQDLTKIVSNLFICLPCFKLRMQRKCCALCQTFDENSNSKLVKCGNCQNIVHAECEKLTDEMYDIIHHLPLSSTYICCTCSPAKKPTWKESVNTALRNGFHIVLRLLTRNPSARDIMKWNLLKNISCSCVTDNTFKQISYSNDIHNEYDETDSDLSTAFRECNSDESQSNKCNNMDDIKNKDNQFDISFKNIRKKFCIKECSVRIKNCFESKKKNVSNNIGKKDCDKDILNNNEDKKNSITNCELNNANTIKSHCNKHDVLPIFLLLNIKRNINANMYKTVKEFYFEVQQALKKSFCHELLNVLDIVIKDTFPWYNPQSYVCQEYNFVDKSPMNIPRATTRAWENSISSQNETLSASLKEKVEKTVSNKCLSENKTDTRRCVLCPKIGDGPITLEGRLLYCGQDEWIHINCAFWSSQVYEELDCSLQNVHEVIINSRKSFCSLCKESGASIYCSVQSCCEHFHYMCARVANCRFFTNKTVCCSSHYDPTTYKFGIINAEDIEIQRPMYIHVDIKKSKHVELPKVQYLIGCLNVTNLGTFFPPLSDTEEAIIPSEFVCSRLFWSTTEPWKIVRYTINTSILIPTLKNLDETENNFTVDHSQFTEEISRKMEISKLNNKLDYGKFKNKLMNSKDYDKESINITDDDKIVLQVLENLLELICSKEVEENCDDEPQNTADILPPELKDAIFEDLPHDLLDGISVQDIFPKLMSYEDIITADLKLADSIDSGESVKSSSSSDSYNSDPTQLKSRKSDLLVTGTDLWLEPKYSIHSFEDFSTSGKDISGQHLKRSKSEIFTGIKKITRTCNHQRSCSLTWSCKLDNTRPLNTKKRKLSCTPKSVADISNNLFMLVDGNSEKNSMLQELRLPDSVLMSVGHSTNVDCLSDSVRELKYCLEENQEIEHEKENNCRVWRNKPQSRIVQLDGAGDSSSENESGNESKSELKSVPFNKSNDEPVQCEKCQCTYRTHSSYKKHLAICASMSSSESDSDEEEEEKEQGSLNEYISNHALNKTVNSVVNDAVKPSIVSESSVKVINSTSTDNSNITQDVNIMTISTDNNYMMSCSQSVYIPSTSVNVESNKNIETPSSTNFKEYNTQASVHVNQYVVKNTEIVTSTVSNVQRNTNELSSLASFVENTSQKLPISKVSSVKKITKQRNNIKTRPAAVVRNKKSPVKRRRVEKTIGMAYNTPQSMNTTNNAVGPTIIIQHLSSPNLMPAYVEAFQQQTGQNLQCIATIVPNEYKTSTPLITSNSFIPGGFQMQATETSNLLSIPTDGFSVMPGLDTVTQSRPMLGTYIHPNRPTTNYQCGMVSTEQLILGSVPTLDPVVNDLQNSPLYFSSSPVYYGFEAIVQNTVMSSQQFVSSTLPGVLSANSSYSATTTQVFQSSKLEPIVDMNGTSYIVVNSSVPQNLNLNPPSITVNPHPIFTSFPNKPNGLTQHHQQPILESPSSETYPVQIIPVTDSFVPVVKPVIIEQPVVQCVKPNIVNPGSNVLKTLPPSTEINTNSIILPFDTENKIPMNVVTPTPQVTTPVSQVLKPTNRVLPMQTQPPKPAVNNKVVAVEPPNILNKLSQTVDKIQETLQNDAKSLQSIQFNSNKSHLLKLESASLKLVFQKQSEDGIYKISNKYVSKKKVPIKVAPIKKPKVQVPENAARELIEQNGKNKILPKPDNSPNLLYKMQSQDGFDYSSTSLTELWKNVFNAVQSARVAHKMPLLPDDAFNVISGLQLLGLNSNGLRYLIEQLPGVGNCIKYKPVAHKKIKFPDDKTFRAARCEPYMFLKQPYDMFSWLASEHRNPDYIHQIDYDYACRRASSVNLPMAMRFRQLKETSKQTVGVYRSGIHGRGLFCLRDIECGEMVIEYAGEVIRSTLTDKREKYYNSKGIGCYMFRVDDNFVIDATMKGNAARFINHSCDPNCYSRVLEILGHKHILIFALRKIIQGEELTYDYKFPFEEDKIPCTCGAKRCRKYLN